MQKQSLDDEPNVEKPLHAPAPQTVDTTKERERFEKLSKEQQELLRKQDEERRREQQEQDKPDKSKHDKKKEK